MTEKQAKRLYWPEWSKVKKLLLQLRVIEPSEAEAKRHEIHREALGYDKSSKQFNNRELDRVLDAFQRYLNLGGAGKDDRAVDGEKKRLLHAINKLGFDSTYIEAITQDRWHRTDWQNLPESDLRQLKITLTERKRAQKRQAKATVKSPSSRPKASPGPSTASPDKLREQLRRRISACIQHHSSHGMPEAYAIAMAEDMFLGKPRKDLDEAQLRAWLDALETRGNELQEYLAKTRAE